MKRYRIINGDFDTRATILAMEIHDHWEDRIKNQWQNNQQNIINRLRHSFGEELFELKLQNFIELGPKPFSILAFHNKFLEQVRFSFVSFGYYPALCGCCALGERILNHLILTLKDDYKSTNEYKHIYRKESFDNWVFAINILNNWGVFLPSTTELFLKLHETRNNSIHFKYDVDYKDREHSLNAILLLQRIIDSQFGMLTPKPWFIPNANGSSYIKKEYENNPFVSKIYLPNALYVGPKHKLVFNNNRWEAIDEEYDNVEITDEQFTNKAKEYGQA